MKVQTVIDIRQFMQQYFDILEESVTEKIFSYCLDDVAILVVVGGSP